MSTAAATRMSPLPAKGAKGTLHWRVDITIIGWIHEAIVGAWYQDQDKDLSSWDQERDQDRIKSVLSALEDYILAK